MPIRGIIFDSFSKVHGEHFLATNALRGTVQILSTRIQFIQLFSITRQQQQHWRSRRCARPLFSFLFPIVIFSIRLIVFIINIRFCHLFRSNQTIFLNNSIIFTSSWACWRRGWSLPSAWRAPSWSRTAWTPPAPARRRRSRRRPGPCRPRARTRSLQLGGKCGKTV